MRYRHRQDYPARSQPGFTLLELMVVLVILGTLVGLGSTAYRAFERRARVDLAWVEMQRIGRAIQRLQRDVGYFPGIGRFSISANSADLSWLFQQPLSIPAWHLARRRGWHGPYLEPGAADPVAASALVCGQRQQLDQPAEQDPFALAFAAQHDIGLSDTFVRSSDADNTPTQRCFARWQAGRWQRQMLAGQPYHYLTDFFIAGHPQCPDSQHRCIALQSFGPDGRDSHGLGDDLILVLHQQPLMAVQRTAVVVVPATEADR